MSTLLEVLEERALAKEFNKDSIRRALTLFAEMVYEEGPPAGMDKEDIDLVISEAVHSLSEL